MALPMSGGVFNLDAGNDAIKNPDQKDSTAENPRKMVVVDLGNESQDLHIPQFITYQDSWKYFEYLDKNIPGTRPTIRVFARSHVQPRDSCYIASEGVPKLVYSLSSSA